MSNPLFGSASVAHNAFASLIILYWVSEALIYRRSQVGPKDSPDDRGSLRLLAMVFAPSWWIGVALTWVRAASFGSSQVFLAGLIVMACGQLLRWWSVATLGRLFTVTVAIRDEHKLVESGPYRYVRHPSYSAILLVHLGAALCLGNWLSLTVLTVPVAAALLYRIRVEESVLRAGLGPAYLAYMARTKRLIPGLY